MSNNLKITINAPLILKVRDIIFFFAGKHIMGHFAGFFEGTENFLTSKLSWAQRRAILGGDPGCRSASDYRLCFSVNCRQAGRCAGGTPFSAESAVCTPSPPIAPALGLAPEPAGCGRWSRRLPCLDSRSTGLVTTNSGRLHLPTPDAASCGVSFRFSTWSVQL
jgi:hypothetical protein